MPKENTFVVSEMVHNLTLLEMHSRVARENLVMKIECLAAADASSNLVQAGTEVLGRIQNGQAATVKMPPAERAKHQAELHGDVFDASLNNVLAAAARLQHQLDPAK